MSQFNPPPSAADAPPDDPQPRPLWPGAGDSPTPAADPQSAGGAPSTADEPRIPRQAGSPDQVDDAGSAPQTLPPRNAFGLQSLPAFGVPGSGSGQGYQPPTPGFGPAGSATPGYGSAQTPAGYGSAPQTSVGYGAGSQPPGYGSAGQPPGYGSGGQPPGYGSGGQPPGYGSGGQAPGYGSAGQAPGYGSGTAPFPGGYAPAVPGGYPSPGYGPPPFGGYPGYVQPVPPTVPKKSKAPLVILIVVLVLALLCGVGGLAAVLTKGSGSGSGANAHPSSAVQSRPALEQLIQRRVKAVLAHDEKAFLADVDPNRPNFVQREKDEFATLVALDLSSLQMSVFRIDQYPISNPDPAMEKSFDTGLSTLSVSVKYAVKGVDAEPVAAPWIPVVGHRDGHWLIADDMVSGSKSLPQGVGGLPWQAGASVVKRSDHIVAVVSKDDERLAPQLMQYAEAGVTNALNFLPTGWPGKVLVIAVSDTDVISSYFRDNMEQLGSVAAVAVQGFSEVYPWSNSEEYVTSRVLFNPDSLATDTEQLKMTLTHEFIHVATGPFTTERTPLWLVEGIAEYVAYDTGKVPTANIKYWLNHYGYPTGVPGDSNFYADGYVSYLHSALACRYVASKYGKAKLLALYHYFENSSSESTGIQSVLGVSSSAFDSGYVSYVKAIK